MIRRKGREIMMRNVMPNKSSYWAHCRHRLRRAGHIRRDWTATTSGSTRHRIPQLQARPLIVLATRGRISCKVMYQVLAVNQWSPGRKNFTVSGKLGTQIGRQTNCWNIDISADLAEVISVVVYPGRNVSTAVMTNPI